MMSEYDFSILCEKGDIDAVNLEIKNIIANNLANKKMIATCLALGRTNARRAEIDNIELEKKSKGYWDRGLLGACKGGHLNIVNLMIEKGADFWNAGLTGACFGGHLDIAEYMIEKGANELNNGLFNACHGKHRTIVEWIVKKGANDWNLGLVGACSGGDPYIVNMMIDYGADDLNRGLSSAWNYPNIIILLIKRCVNIDIRGWNMLFHSAVDAIDSDIIKLLVEKKVPLENSLEYPRDERKILKLWELGMPIDSFKYISGFNKSAKYIEEKKKAAGRIAIDIVKKVLINVVNQYAIGQLE